MPVESPPDSGESRPEDQRGNSGLTRQHLRFRPLRKADGNRKELAVQAKTASKSAPPSAAPATPRRPAYWPDGVDSRLGGLFYLINLMAHLGLPACFAPDWPAGPWESLELLARGLIAPTGDAFLPDPAWSVLAALDGRPEGLPAGHRLAPGAPFRLPPDWLRHVGAEGGEAWWQITEGRLVAWHDSGFPLLDLPAASSLAEAELLPYGIAGMATSAPPPPTEEAPGPLLDGLGAPARRWLRLVLPYIRLRLRLALSEPPDADLTRDLLQMPARLYVTRSHLDVVMRLRAVSLPVRMAGLDRNPGWMREFGRVITFHFR